MSNPISELGLPEHGADECTPEEVADVDRLFHKLMRPQFVLQMARPYERQAGPRGQGSAKRAHRAREEIHYLVMQYARDHQHDT